MVIDDEMIIDGYLVGFGWSMMNIDGYWWLLMAISDYWWAFGLMLGAQGQPFWTILSSNKTCKQETMEPVANFARLSS